MWGQPPVTVQAEGDEGDDGSGDVEGHLNDVGPDDGGHAALERVEQGEGGDDGDGEDVSPVPMASETTMEMAKTRTPSAAARVRRKSPAVILWSALLRSAGRY